MTPATFSKEELAGLTVGILGLGQIGGSLAAALKSARAAQSVIGFDVDSEMVKIATERGIIDSATSNAAECIAGSDIVFIATHHHITLQLLNEHYRHLADKLLVTDTGSLKHEIVTRAQQLQLSSFVGGHPVAGSEKKGAASWSATLFDKAEYVITSGATTNTRAAACLGAIIETLGAHPVSVDPIEHDRHFALTIGLPHVLAYTLTGMLRTAETGNAVVPLLTGPSWRGATRVAASDVGFVEQMLWNNREHLTTQLDKLLAQLNEFRQSLSDGGSDNLRERLQYGSLDTTNDEDSTQ